MCQCASEAGVKPLPAVQAIAPPPSPLPHAKKRPSSAMESGTGQDNQHDDDDDTKSTCSEVTVYEAEEGEVLGPGTVRRKIKAGELLGGMSLCQRKPDSTA